MCYNFGSKSSTERLRNPSAHSSGAEERSTILSHWEGGRQTQTAVRRRSCFPQHKRADSEKQGKIDFGVHERITCLVNLIKWRILWWNPMLHAVTVACHAGSWMVGPCPWLGKGAAPNFRTKFVGRLVGRLRLCLYIILSLLYLSVILFTPY